MVWGNARILQYHCRWTNLSSSSWHGSGLWLSSSYEWTFHCDPSGGEWRTAHCNARSKSLRSPNIYIPLLGFSNKWNHLTIKTLWSGWGKPCQHLTSRKKPHVAWLNPRVLSIFLPMIFLISLFCYLSLCPWRSSEITLCDGLLQVFFFYKWTFGF